MKKLQILLPLAAVLLSLTGCKKDNEKSGPSGETVTLSATLGGGEKTEIYGGTKMKWSEGDKVNINGTDYTATFPFDDGTHTQASFVGVASADEYVAIYPASLYRSQNVYELPSTQTYAGNTLSLVSPMYAVTETTELQFHNIFALVKLQVTGTGTVRTIVVTSDNSLCSTFTVSKDGGKYHAVISGSGSTTLILNCGAGVDLNTTNPTTFYIALPQGTLSNLKFKIGDNESTPVNANLTAGKLYTKSLENVEVSVIEFSVSATQKVKFAPGNLQYLGKSDGTGTWRFAEHQWDYMGDGPSSGTTNQGNVDLTSLGYTTGMYNTGSNTTGPNETEADKSAARDLFGWGTTGFQDTRTSSTGYQRNYQPYSTSKTRVGNTSPAYNVNPFRYGPDYDATNEYGLSVAYLSDWGYNAISNGGNRENAGWRTLTKDEWSYLLNTSGSSGRTDANRFAKAKVNGVCGLLIFPDGYNGGTAIGSITGVAALNTTTAAYPGDNIPEDTWSSMESSGAVFLPAAGYRHGTLVYDVGSGGNYWSSTPNSAASPTSAANAYQLNFGSGKVASTNYSNRCIGFSVRLVLPVEN